MHRFIFLMIVALAAIPGFAQIPDTTNPDIPRIIYTKYLVLPPKFLEAVEDSFPGFRVLTFEDYLAWGTESEFVYNYNDSKYRVPHAAWGDFNCDSLTDIATYLVSVDYIPGTWGNDSPCMLVVFHGTREGGYSPYILEKGKGWPGGNVIGTVKPGKQLTVKGKGYEGTYPKDFPDFILLKCNAIASGKFGSAGGMFYWEDGKYKNISTSD